MSLRVLGATLLFLALIYGVAVSMPLARRYRADSIWELRAQHAKVAEELDEREKTKTLPEGGMARLRKMRDERIWLRFSVLRKDAAADVWVPWLAAVGVALVILSFIPWEGKKAKKAVKDVDSKLAAVIPETVPREEYVDEWEFSRRSEGGFKNREEAIQWLLQDPLLKCDYCGSRLRSTFQGEREALELVTFYKSVPEGAKDMRIVLGSFWYVKAASELKCTGCERVVRR